MLPFTPSLLLRTTTRGAMKPSTSKSSDNSDVLQTCPCLCSKNSLEPGAALISTSICLRMPSVGSAILFLPFRIGDVDLTSVSAVSVFVWLQNGRTVSEPDVVDRLRNYPELRSL